MNRLTLTTLIVIAGLTGALLSPLQAAGRAPDPARFFANPEVQALAPGAFAVQPSAVPMLEAVDRVAPAQRAALVAAIQADPELSAAIARFPELAWPEKLAALKRVMELECRAFGAATPPLVVHPSDEVGRGPAFFEFDPDKPGTGIVHLWPAALADEPSPHAALLLTIHETRHSWQFQTAFGPAAAKADPALVAGFAAGFRAQKGLSHKLSFCDFCTMHHEHEAFQTGNAVVGMLTGWTANTAGMGCWSSQFDAQGRLKIDLLSLVHEVGPEALLGAFNEREKGQFEEGSK